MNLNREQYISTLSRTGKDDHPGTVLIQTKKIQTEKYKILYSFETHIFTKKKIAEDIILPNFFEKLTAG